MYVRYGTKLNANIKINKYNLVLGPSWLRLTSTCAATSVWRHQSGVWPLAVDTSSATSAWRGTFRIIIFYLASVLRIRSRNFLPFPDSIRNQNKRIRNWLPDPDSIRIRNLLPVPDSITNQSKYFGSAFETNFKPEPEPKPDPKLLFRIHNTPWRTSFSKMFLLRTMLYVPIDAFEDKTIPNAKCPNCNKDTGNTVTTLLVRIY